MCTMDETVFSILDKFSLSLRTVCQELTEIADDRQNDDLNTDEFWDKFVGCTELVSHDATKIGVMFKDDSMPSVAACQSLINSMEGHCIALAAIFYSLPKSRGTILRKDLQVFVLTIFQSIQDLCAEVKRKSSSKLQTLGRVWEECEAVQKLPRENKSAVLSLIQGQLLIVQDALEEIQMCMNTRSEEQAGEDFSHPEDFSGIHPLMHWTDADLQLLPSCVGLIKTVKACLKRTNAIISSNGNIDNNVSIEQLDSVAEICKSSSSFVDDFALSLYPPIEYETLQVQASLIADIFGKLLSTICDCHFCKEEDKKSWITFLRSVIDHNYWKIVELVQERLPEED